MQAERPVLALTVGEPAGIGPEIAIRAAWALRGQANCVLVGDAAFLALTASLGVAVLIVTNLILLPVLLSCVGVSPAAARRSLQAAPVSAATAGGMRRLWAALPGLTQRRAALRTLLDAHPDDRPASKLLARVLRLQDDPPPEGWDGVYVAVDK